MTSFSRSSKFGFDAARLKLGLAIAILALALTACVGAIAVRGALGGLGRAAAGSVTARAALGTGIRIGGGLASRGSLRAALAELTAGGRIRPTVLIDNAGRFHVAGRHLLTLEASGDLVLPGSTTARTIVGRFRNGKIWQPAIDGSSWEPIGRVVAYSNGLRMPLRSGPSASARVVANLRRGTTAELLQRRGDWFEIRLSDGTSGWAWGHLVALATLLGIDEREDDRPVVEGYLPQAHLTVRSGQSFWARNVQVLDGMVTGLDAQNARFAIDQSIVKRINPVEDEAVEVDWAHQARVVELRSGISLNAHMCFRRDDRIEVRLFPVMQLEFGGEPGKTLVLDPELAKNC